VAPSSLDRQPGDEALADAIRRELREDAATTELKIQVEVVEGIAYLRGAVPHMEDLDAVEAVAGEVPGVREVVDELEVQAA
jgi:osmotically-inducible protein OsmY